MSHIALLLPDLEVGGAQRVMLLLAREFVGRGHNVDLILLSPSGPLMDNIPKGVKVVDFAARSFSLGQMGLVISSTFRLSAWLKRKSPDVLLSTITGTNLVALLAQKFAAGSARIVIREAVTLKNITSTLRLLAMRRLYPQADAVIALSPFMAIELSEKVGVASASIHCIANPVDVEFIIEQGGMPIEHHWLDKEHHKVVISVGRLILQKDYATLLRAFSLLPRELSVRLVIVGEGTERVGLEQLAMDLGIADITQFVGFDANPWRWMARANLFVLSSRWEGHPNALLEALALNLPVVATEYDASVSELAARYGFKVVPVGNVTSLAQAIGSQLSAGLQQSYRLADEVPETVSDYLGVLGCNESPFSRIALDHETTSTAK